MLKSILKCLENWKKRRNFAAQMQMYGPSDVKCLWCL